MSQLKLENFRRCPVPGPEEIELCYSPNIGWHADVDGTPEKDRVLFHDFSLID
jgi:hypothetical protein